LRKETRSIHFLLFLALFTVTCQCLASSSLRSATPAEETTATATVTKTITSNLTETVTRTLTTVYAFLPTTIYVTETFTFLVPTSVKLFLTWTTIIQTTRIDTVTTQTVTTRIWTGASDDYRPLGVLIFSFFGIYIALIRFKRSRKPDENMASIIGLMVAAITGLFSDTWNTEIPYFWLTGVLLGLFVGVTAVASRIMSKRPDRKPSKGQ